MSLLSRKGLLAVTAVLDIALYADGQPVAARALAHRHRLPPRHLEPVLQALVRQGVLKGIRGPHGGYLLARDPHQITAGDILRAIGTIDDEEEGAVVKSTLLTRVVVPQLARAEVAFSTALARINVEDLLGAAKVMRRFAA
jgi:Rrf2 family protein